MIKPIFSIQIQDCFYFKCGYFTQYFMAFLFFAIRLFSFNGKVCLYFYVYTKRTRVSFPGKNSPYSKAFNALPLKPDSGF